MADSANNVDRELKTLEIELRRLEAEYNMYFAGRSPRPPVETRRRVANLVRQLDRQRLNNYADRFRFTTLQSRFQTFVELWDRGMRSREEGRPGPFASRTAQGTGAKASRRREAEGEEKKPTDEGEV
jgi:hypothetical protein